MGSATVATGWKGMAGRVNRKDAGVVWGAVDRVGMVAGVCGAAGVGDSSLMWQQHWPVVQQDDFGGQHSSMRTGRVVLNRQTSQRVQMVAIDFICSKARRRVGRCQAAGAGVKYAIHACHISIGGVTDGGLG